MNPRLFAILNEVKNPSARTLTDILMDSSLRSE
ncbi:hypothetical protein SAMN05444173_3159 [Opitutus sp. GAS368]|nr:hypothetical protein SAMN05444173_3159 [Opitutus sp. GAS368]